MIKKPGILPEEETDGLDGQGLLEAQNDYCYKEMLGQFIEWGNLICEEHPNEPARRGFRWFFKHDCPKCWEALQSQLEEG